MNLLDLFFPPQSRAPRSARHQQSIAVFHGTNRMAASTAPRRGIAAIGSLNKGGGISPGGGHGGKK